MREVSQSRRTSIKRPWEDISLPEEGITRYPASLPSIDPVPLRRPSIPLGFEHGVFSNSRYGPDTSESVVKKQKFEGYDYNSFPHQIPAHHKIPPTQSPNPGYSQHRGSIQSPIFSPTQRAVASGGPAESQDTPNLCVRCRRLTTRSEALELHAASDTCENCSSNPELAWVAQKTAAQITQLAETLRSGISSERRGVIRGPNQRDFGLADFPPIAQFGLKQGLNWILDRITHCNYMVDELVEQVPAGTLQIFDKESPEHGNNPQDGPPNIMKRRIDVDPEEAFRTRGENVESMSDTRPHTRRRSVTTGPMLGEDNPQLRSQSDYHPSLHSLDGQASRVSIMNPPPAPTRQLPSPPGRSFPSPTSINFPSPSGSQYSNAPQAVNLPLPSSLHQPTTNSYLPPIAATHSPDSALREHSAALQHEVSVQKIKLSSLQGEHDKLLAAFSRSQLRASALEKKHAVSDSEIISLTEEKLRLQTQVTDLERDVDELSRSRDEYRQAAVQEGSQYVEIVKKASRLEEMAAEERKSWNKLKDDMERRIEALSGGRIGKDSPRAATSTSDVISARRIADDMDTDTPASSVDLSTDLKMEPLSEGLLLAPRSHPFIAQQESTEDLREEIRRLRERCTDVENSLRAIRDDSRSMEGIVKSLQERADSALKD